MMGAIISLFIFLMFTYHLNLSIQTTTGGIHCCELINGSDSVPDIARTFDEDICSPFY